MPAPFIVVSWFLFLIVIALVARFVARRMGEEVRDLSSVIIGRWLWEALVYVIPLSILLAGR